MVQILLFFLIISVLFNIILFLIAYKLQSDKLTDISYALTFLIIAITAYVFNYKTIYSTVILSIIILWSIRIGGFLLYRVIKTGKDSRFDSMRSNFIKFGRFWLLQGISVWLLMISVILAIYNNSNQFGLFSFIGLAVFITGLSIETVADFQKLKFHNDIANKGIWINSGLWKYSRHPNYFGEIIIWFGLYIFAVQSFNIYTALMALVSPLSISLLLIFISGIPLLEKSADKKWGSDKKYLEYKRKTSVLFLLPNWR